MNVLEDAQDEVRRAEGVHRDHAVMAEMWLAFEELALREGYLAGCPDDDCEPGAYIVTYMGKALWSVLHNAINHEGLVPTDGEETA